MIDIASIIAEAERVLTNQVIIKTRVVTTHPAIVIEVKNKELFNVEE